MLAYCTSYCMRSLACIDCVMGPLQKKFGKCDASFLLDKGYCAATCNRCWSYQYPPPAPPCADIAPDPIFTCEQQVSLFLV